MERHYHESCGLRVLAKRLTDYAYSGATDGTVRFIGAGSPSLCEECHTEITWPQYHFISRDTKEVETQEAPDVDDEYGVPGYDDYYGFDDDYWDVDDDHCDACDEWDEGLGEQRFKPCAFCHGMGCGQCHYTGQE